MKLLITLFIAFVFAKEPEVAPILGFSNNVVFDHTGSTHTMKFNTFLDNFNKAVESNVEHVICFIDYNINTYDFEEFTKYNGYSTLRNLSQTATSSFEGEQTTISFSAVFDSLPNITDKKIGERTLYLYSDPATLTDPILLGLSHQLNVRIVNQDDFTQINQSALIFVAFRNVGAFDILSLNEDVMKSYFSQNVNSTKAVFYGSLRLVEKNTISSSTWYNTATISILFTILILVIIVWFMMHFMLAVQSIGPAVFARPKTD